MPGAAMSVGGSAGATPERNVARWRELHERGYFRNHNKYRDRLHREGVERLVRYLRPRAADTLLEVGCGYGRLLYRLAPMVGRAIGVDLAPEPLAEARKLLAGRGQVELIQGAGVGLGRVADGSVDAAYAFTVFQHMTREGAAGYLREMARVLAPGGRVCVQFLTGGDAEGAQRDEAREQSLSYTREQVAAMCRRAGLRVVRLELEELDHPEFDWLWLTAGKAQPSSASICVEHREAIAQVVRPRRGARLLVIGDEGAAEELRPALGQDAAVVALERAPPPGNDRFEAVLLGLAAGPEALAAAAGVLGPGGLVFVRDGQRPELDAAKLRFKDWMHVGADEHGVDLWCGGLEPVRADGPTGRPPVIVSFFTRDTPYEIEARRLIDSCRRLRLDFEIDGVEPFGAWEKNCAYKARHMLAAWRRLRAPILWVDADAIVRREPLLLAGELGRWADFGVHKFDGWQFASGTIYFNRTEAAGALLEAWARRCEEDPLTWDQVHLDLAWEEVARSRPLKTLWLPQAYTKIFDAPPEGRDGPVIEHFQASRAHKQAVTEGTPRPAPVADEELKSARRASRARVERIAEGEDDPTSVAGDAGPVEPGSLEAVLARVERLAELSRRNELFSLDALPAIMRIQATADAARASQAKAEVRAAALKDRLIEQCALRCVERGIKRIAIYGAGWHTAPIVRQPWAWHGIEVVAILDDNPKRESLSGVRIIRPEELRETIDAVVVSSDSHEAAIAAAAARKFGSRGVPVLRIYGDAPTTPDAGESVRRLVERYGLTDADARWLVDNRGERHDATLPMLPPRRTELHLRRYELAALHAPGKRVLDLACGTGYGSALLADRGAASVIGVDVDARTIEYANRRHARPGRVTFVCGEIGAARIADASADVIVSFETIEHVPDLDGMLSHCARALAPEGHVILSTPNEGGPTEHHCHSFTRASLGARLADHFGGVEWLGQRAGDEPRSGELPPGVYPLGAEFLEPEYLIAIARRPKAS